MLYFPPCKINIGLHIIGKRPDGFHDLELSFFPLWQVCDILEITPARTDSFLCSGIPTGGEDGDNIVVKARENLRGHLREACGKDLPACRIHLHKNLPAGSGLGGGSSDAAYALMGLDQVFRLGMQPESLAGIAARTGSDCAFFLQQVPCIGKGKGDCLQKLETGLRREFGLVLIVPPLHVSTAEAYRDCQTRSGRPGLASLLECSIHEWKNVLENDFEKTLFPRYPILSKIKERLYESGAFYASLSGSGSALYGLFESLSPDFPDPSGLPEGIFMRRTRISIP